MKNIKKIIGSIGAPLIFVCLLVSCASAPAVSAPPDKALPEIPIDEMPTTVRYAVLFEAEKHIDTPYLSPPRVPHNFDCSGFVNYIFSEAAEMNLPTASGAYLNVGTVIDFKDAEPGDLLIFTSEPNGSKINHVATLYKKSPDGELRGSLLIHAVSIATKTSTIQGNPDHTGVKITELGKRGDGKWQQEYFLARFFEVRRVLE
jgi:cell wall-associated NlpC family hydrolase